MGTLRKLHFWQIFALLGLNVIIYILVTLRWWLDRPCRKKGCSLFSPACNPRGCVWGQLLHTRSAGGWGAVQVLVLQRNYGMTYTHATSTVVMDKLLEFLANLVLLGIGLSAVFQAGIFSANDPSLFASLLGLIILLLWPPIHIILLYHGKYPISAVLRKFSNNKFVRFVAASERLAGTFCRRHLWALVSAIFVSVFAALGMVFEFFCITYFLGIHLSFWQIIAVWMAGWLAFLVPLPGGLGVLEASQVFAFGAFGISAVLAIGVTLLIRARDLLIGGVGLLIAGRGAKKP